MHKTSSNMHNNQNNHINSKYEVEERRRKVAFMLAQSMTETEIASQLHVNQSTISRDIRSLKEQSQQFVYDLAKSDLAFYYKQCIDGIEQVVKKAWEMFHNDSGLKSKDKLLALKVIRESHETKFALFERGPNIMNIKALEERLNCCCDCCCWLLRAGQSCG
jgi:DNA-binding CsgD family transcriptional regulator